MMRRLKSIASGRSSVSDPVRMLDLSFSPSFYAPPPGQRFAARPLAEPAFGVNDQIPTCRFVSADLLSLARPAASSWFIRCLAWLLLA